MYTEKKLELVHFQITKSCNLRCWFCGQWGNKGFFSEAFGNPMQFSDWEKVAKTLSEYRNSSGNLPSVMLWGGEPLISPDFGKTVKMLRDYGFELGLVTNGVFIDKWADILRKDFKKIHISIDGTRHIHDSVRGAGVYDKVMKNAELLKDCEAEVIIMSVKSLQLAKEIEIFANELEKIKPSALYLHDMISLNNEEIDNYSKWMKKAFGKDATDIYSWKSDKDVKKIDFTVPSGHSFEIIEKKHGILDCGFCLSPFRHAHIAWNGEVMYCTDFYDFSAGNVKEKSIIEIFNNSLSEKFRNEIASGKCATCAHCSWREDKKFSF